VKLTVVRTQFGTDATNGLLFIDGVFECYTLEDQYQAVKVMHETCIPEGTYDIEFRKTGGFHAKYSERYKNAHYGMLHIQDVPNFTYILIHTGNTDEHTSGCLIVGETQQDLEISKDGFIGSSTVAYKKMYAKVAGQLLQGKKVTIEYTTINKLLEKEVDNKAKEHTVLANTVYEKLQEINGNVLTIKAKLNGKVIM
jgi:RNase P/RNase MRP subunit p29|tara:strand:- start:503 stop:1093 length:591 start_codon:yes stop_codon:yes gene_type:complete